MASLLTNYIQDNWDDNSLTSRSGTSEGLYEHPNNTTDSGNYLKAVVRPDWTTESGSPSATNQELQLPAGDTTLQAVKTPSNFDSGFWQFDWQFNADPTVGELEFTAMSISPTLTADAHFQDGYYLEIGNAGSYDIDVDNAGAVANFINSSWGSGGSGDTSQHTAKITRNPYSNFELFQDGSSVGTGTNTSHVDSRIIAIGNDTDQQVNIDSLQLQ